MWFETVQVGELESGQLKAGFERFMHDTFQILTEKQFIKKFWEEQSSREKENFGKKSQVESWSRMLF